MKNPIRVVASALLALIAGKNGAGERKGKKKGIGTIEIRQIGAIAGGVAARARRSDQRARVSRGGRLVRPR